MPVAYIMIPAALLGIYGLFISTDYYARLITVLMLISVVMTFLPVPAVKTGGFALYAIALVLAVVYALLKRGFSNAKRALILAMIIPAFTAIIFQLNGWPGVSLLYGFSIITILSFAAICLRQRDYRNELGFLVIIAADALIHAVIFFNWQLYKPVA
jgi:hypothetical protein